MTTEESVWQNTNPTDLWLLDKLILSKYLGYKCGPGGTDVPEPGWYIVRPVINALGGGLGARDVWLDRSTDHLPLGHFWCEIFEGRHLSIDYEFGRAVLAVEGTPDPQTYRKWREWRVVNDTIEIPECLRTVTETQPFLNIEYIGKNPIEIHFRHNPDFVNGAKHIIPLWRDEQQTKPPGYEYTHSPDPTGRIGFFSK